MPLHEITYTKNELIALIEADCKKKVKDYSIDVNRTGDVDYGTYREHLVSIVVECEEVSVKPTEKKKKS